MDDGFSLVRPVLVNHPNTGFTPLKTIWIASFEAVLSILLGVTTFLFAFAVRIESVTCGLFYMVVYAHACLWCIYFILDHCLKWHHLQLRKEGYLEFYDECNKYATLPFYVTSCYNALLAVTLAIYSEMSTNSYYFCDESKFTSPPNFIVFLIVLENFILLPIFTHYVVGVLEFNKSRRAPDTELDTRWMPSVLRDSIISGEVGYRERAETIDNMLEKQADLIRYYKESNEQLNRRVLELTVQSRSRSINA